MKLRNKKTGEIGYFCFANWNDPVLIIMDKDGVQLTKYTSLVELNEEWGDYEEPKKHYSITQFGDVVDEVDGYMSETIDEMKQIGNYFESREEAEKAVEKLKAWKRLKDTYHIRFDLDFVKNIISFTYRLDGTLHSAVNEERIIFEDMKTIFGGE